MTGLIEGYWAQPSGGPRRKYYRLSPDGDEQLARWRWDWRAFTEAVDWTRWSKEARMLVRHEWEAVTGVIERCRALWVLTEVSKPTADEMAAELEAHLREHVAAGGAIEDVVGTDLGKFAAARGTQRRESMRTPPACFDPSTRRSPQWRPTPWSRTRSRGSRPTVLRSPSG